LFPTINAEYRAAKRADADNSLILESVLDVDETLPGSDEEMESIVDPDSVPDDVYAKIDKELDKIVEDPSYDDTEAEEMLDDDFDVDDISDAEIDAIMDEAVAMMERKDKIAGVFANLSEKAGNNMGNSTGMGLLKTLSESVNQFQGGKMSDPIGKAYEPVETPDDSIDETKLENEALKESAVNAALARFHSLMEASNPDVEDFPGKEGTTQADGDTPAGMPEPNGDEDGNNVGGDDQVVDQEAKEVGVEDGGSDAIDVIKANESVSRYRAIVEATKGEDKAIRIGSAITGGVTGAVAGAIGSAKTSKEVNAAKAELEKAEASGDANAVADAREKLRNTKISSAKRGAVKYGALGTAAGYGLGHATNKVNKMMYEAVTNPDIEDGGSDEAASRYMTIIEAAKAKAAGKEVCPKCGKCDCVCETLNGDEAIDESLESAKTHLDDAKIFRDRAKTYSNTARQSLNNNWTSNGGPNGQLPKGRNTISSVNVTGTDSLATTDNMKRAAKYNNIEAIKQLGAAAKEAAKDKRVQLGAAGAAGAIAAGMVAKKHLDAKKAKAEEDKKSLKESITNPDVEDFPNQTGAGNDHGEKEGALPEGQEPADFPNSTGDKKVNSGDVPTNRYKVVAETSIRPPKMPEYPVCPKCGYKHNPNLARCPKDVVRTSSVVEAAMAHLMEASNPNVEDFPKAEGTHSAEGNGVPAGMSHEDDSVQPAYTDQSDFEQKEVGVEDGGTDAIDVIKANESSNPYAGIIEAATAKMHNRMR